MMKKPTYFSSDKLQLTILADLSKLEKSNDINPQSIIQLEQLITNYEKQIEQATQILADKKKTLLNLNNEIKSQLDFNSEFESGLFGLEKEVQFYSRLLNEEYPERYLTDIKLRFTQLKKFCGATMA